MSHANKIFKEISYVQGGERAAHGLSSQATKEGVGHRDSYGSSMKFKTGYGMGSSLQDIQGSHSQTEKKHEDKYKSQRMPQSIDTQADSLKTPQGFSHFQLAQGGTISTCRQDDNPLDTIE